jgi:hypothetical protein
MAKSGRTLEVTLEPTSGTLNQVVAWLNGVPVIRTDGEAGSWKGTVPAAVKLETAVWGQGKATYTLTIDLPGTADDQTLVLSLTNGYHDAEYRL